MALPKAAFRETVAMSAWSNMSAKPVGVWWVKVKDNAYGPYDDAEMARFVDEGRVKAHTSVASDRAGPWGSAADAGLTKTPAHEPTALRGAIAVEDEDARIANMMIWGELPAGGEAHIESTLDQFGAAARIAPDLWVLRTIHPVSAVRAAIAGGLKPGERFLVVDASRGRLAWSNLGLDSETGLRRVWDARG
jgi:hypothetical protein